MGVLSDLAKGNFSGVWDDIVKSFNRLPQNEKDFIAELESDAWNLVRTLSGVAINDVVAGGFTGDSFRAAAKDVVAQGEAQGQAIAINDAYIQLNILAKALRPNTSSVAPVSGAASSTSS